VYALLGTGPPARRKDAGGWVVRTKLASAAVAVNLQIRLNVGGVIALQYLTISSG